MIIKNISAEVQHIELKSAFITALRRVDKIEFVRLKIECDNGSFAFGEAPATKAITGEDIETILDSIDATRNLFINQDVGRSLEVLHEKTEIGTSAKAALDMAFISLLSQEKNIPLFQYFGAREPVSLHTDITVSLKGIDEMLEDAKVAFNNGKYLLKVKVGSDIEHSIEIINAIASELPKAQILVDANQAWSLEDSLLFVDAMKNVKLELIEQPVIADDLESLKIITNKTEIPILADESAFNLEEVKNIVETQSADMINIKLMKCGGLSKAVEILEYAREHKVTCMLGSMLEGPISINAALHLAMAYTDVIEYIDLDSPLLYKNSSKEEEFIFKGSQIKYNL